MNSATWSSPSNIALIKYWGKYPVQLPANPSVSFTLSECATTTTLEWTAGNGSIQLFLDGTERPDFLPKVQAFFERNHDCFPYWQSYNYVIRTSNSFPHSSGIASSASGMSALALCCMSMKEAIQGGPVANFFEQASEAARLGSGSGSRSVYGPLAVWGKHADVPASDDKFAVPYSAVAPVFTTFQDTVLLVDKGEKKVSSTVGHDLMNGHPYAESRFNHAHQHMSELLDAMKNGDLATFGAIVEREALTLHAMMMASDPYFILMRPNTLHIIEAIWEFRKTTGIHVYFTLDAGANVHVLYPEADKEAVLTLINHKLTQYCKDKSYICDVVGAGPKQLK